MRYSKFPSIDVSRCGGAFCLNLMLKYPAAPIGAAKKDVFSLNRQKVSHNVLPMAEQKTTS